MSAENAIPFHKLLAEFGSEQFKKLTKKDALGYKGWNTDCTVDRLMSMLTEHVRRGPSQAVDIANLAAMIWWHGQPAEVKRRIESYE
jgi:hypothetical protein